MVLLCCSFTSLNRLSFHKKGSLEVGVCLCIDPFPSLMILFQPAPPSTFLQVKSQRQRREDGSVSVSPASAGHLNDSVHHAYWPGAVVPRTRTVKHKAIWRNFCFLHVAATFAPYLMSVGVWGFCLLWGEV